MKYPNYFQNIEKCINTDLYFEKRSIFVLESFDKMPTFDSFFVTQTQELKINIMMRRKIGTKGQEEGRGGGRNLVSGPGG